MVARALPEPSINYYEIVDCSVRITHIYIIYIKGSILKERLVYQMTQPILGINPFEQTISAFSSRQTEVMMLHSDQWAIAKTFEFFHKR